MTAVALVLALVVAFLVGRARQRPPRPPGIAGPLERRRLLLDAAEGYPGAAEAWWRSTVYDWAIRQGWSQPDALNAVEQLEHAVDLEVRYSRPPAAAAGG